MSFKDFLLEPENRKYQKYEDNKEVESVYNFMKRPEIIDKMILSTENNRPALEGIIIDIENNFPKSPEFDIENDYTLRKALGSMIKNIISEFGYEVDRQKEISKGSYIKSATYYKYNKDKVKKRLVKVITIEEV